MQAIWPYWPAAQQQTRTLRRQKLDLFYVKFNAKFHERGFLFLKVAESSQKLAKTKVGQKNANWRRSEAKG